MQNQKYCKRLIEVDLPIKRISEHARREKSIRHGHISTLHGYWARRPLAACRAVLCASLWPDPADPLCPAKFIEVAQKEMFKWSKNYLSLLGGESYEDFIKVNHDSKLIDDYIFLRNLLLDFIADFSNWDNSTKKEYLDTARVLTQTAHEALGGESGSRPMVVDPFAGGGSIPLEALRVGSDVIAIDCNPIAILILKSILEFAPKFRNKLIQAYKKAALNIKNQVKQDVSRYYPADADGSVPMAYLWVRTILCEGPGCGAEIPLIRQLWLSKKRKIALKMEIHKSLKKVDFKIVENISDKEVQPGTIIRGSAVCPICGFTTHVKNVRKQAQNGKLGERLVCVISNHPLRNGRHYSIVTSKDLKIIEDVNKVIAILRKENYENGLSVIPNEKVETEDTFNLRMAIYGFKEWGEIFTNRQLLTLTRFTKEIRSWKDNSLGFELEKAVHTLLALTLDRLLSYCNSLSTWVPRGEYMGSIMAMQAIQMKWDFAELNPFSGASGEWNGAVNWIEKALRHINDSDINSGEVMYSSADELPLPDESVDVIFTDPPYYNNIEYAGLSDFYYVWLKRSIGDRYPEMFQWYLIPKEKEIVQNLAHKLSDGSVKDKKFFEGKMTQALTRSREVLKHNGVAIVVFSHTTTDGWEAMLNSLLHAGYIITSSWPIHTEMEVRTNVRKQAGAVLASSIHLVCRPREDENGNLITDYVGDWRDVLQELPNRIHEWMPRLAKEGVVGADAIFACLGPALEIFSRYSYVEKANGERVELREYLEKVWEAVAKDALSMIFEGAEISGFEEDARLTAMWLWTLSTSKNGNNKKDSANENEVDKITSGPGFSLEYDAARKIAQGLGAHLEKLSGIIEIKGDKARLLSISERVKILFGKDSSSGVVHKRKKKDKQLTLFEELETIQGEDWSLGDKKAEIGRTVLDRVHQAMILFGAGRTEALKRFLVEEGVGRDERFWRLSQALLSLYRQIDPNLLECRWVEGVLGKKKSFGF